MRPWRWVNWRSLHHSENRERAVIEGKSLIVVSFQQSLKTSGYMSLGRVIIDMDQSREGRELNSLLVWPIRIALVTALLFAVGAPVADGQPASTGNEYNDELLKMSPEEQAAKLAAHLGLWCIGTRPFAMGVTKDGPAKGYAYWSVQCAGGESYMVQISPDGKGAAVDCKTLKENGEGRECYKAF
jgi:hypothetical protein